MANTSFAKQLKEKRQTYGVSQNKLAVEVGLTRQYISDIETGKTMPSLERQSAIMNMLERLNPEAELTMLIDYVRIRFPTNDVEHIIHDVLQIKADFMLHEDFGFYGYEEHYVMGDIFVLASQEAEKGTLIELKGRGCRQLESFLLAQHRSWYDFLSDSLVEGGIIKRIDLAINDMTGILDIQELTQKCKDEECVSVFRCFKSYRSGELVKKDEKIGMGNTLYIGSLKSEVYFCIYEKDYEQYVKFGVPIDETTIKNRFEIRLKNERAYHAVIDLLSYYDAERTAFYIINRYLRFVDKEDGKRRTAWKINQRWACFVGEDRGRLKLTTKPEPYTLERTLNWLSRQVAPTLKLAMKLDELNQTSIIQDMITNARLSERHVKIIKQQSTPVEEVVLMKE